MGSGANGVVVVVCWGKGSDGRVEALNRGGCPTSSRVVIAVDILGLGGR